MVPELETIARTAALTFVALVPGASAAAGFEWHSVRYGRRRKDWVLRLLLFSGLWLAAGFWVWHWLAMSYWAEFVALRPVPGLSNSDRPQQKTKSQSISIRRGAYVVRFG